MFYHTPCRNWISVVATLSSLHQKQESVRNATVRNIQLSQLYALPLAASDNMISLFAWECNILEEGKQVWHAYCVYAHHQSNLRIKYVKDINYSASFLFCNFKMKVQCCSHPCPIFNSIYMSLHLTAGTTQNKVTVLFPGLQHCTYFTN